LTAGRLPCIKAGRLQKCLEKIFVFMNKGTLGRAVDGGRSTRRGFRKYDPMGNDAMKEKDLKYFKELLTRWLDELSRHADSTMTGLREVDENLPDPLDRAVFDSERNFTLRIRDRESMLIKKIRKSLEDIEEGGYGICESCGEDISVERLKARPVTHHCIRCKTQMEAMEKQTGT
jgi:DnaK suppressor protein